ncbi:helix-turn-helix domain-containing protein [Vagococcus carniphilus]|uniref:helix-turn-helix domain-containing protein n=1 Tax=Vagococcus carniphilus TaxID=218144 RepID=UPI003B590D48
MEKKENIFGSLLNEYRKKANMTLSELAEKANTSDSYLSQLENGKRNPPKPKLLKDIAEALAKGDGMELAKIYSQLSIKAGYDLQGNEFNEVMISAVNSKAVSGVQEVLKNERGLPYINSAVDVFNTNKDDSSFIMYLNVLLMDLNKYKNSENLIEKKALESEILSIIDELLK